MSAGASPPAWRNLLSAASDEWRATPFYRMMLGGSDPDRVLQWGRDPRRGDAARGADLAAGLWRIASERLTGAHQIPWSAPAPSPHFKARLHAFSWLRDLAAADEAAPIADLIQSWAASFGEWHPEAWAPELVAERLYAWLCHGRPAFEGGDVEIRPALMKSLGRQARHLQLAAGDIRDPLARVKAGAALIMCGCSGMPEGERLTEVGVEILEESSASHFLSDGGHASRAPEALLEAFADLIAADDALARHGLETPRLVRDLLPKIAAMLRYLTLGDGGLAAFNGGGPGDPATLAALLAERDGEGRAFRIAPQSGFYRLAAGDCVLIADAGAAPAAAFGDRAHAGCLAFEMSSGKDRLIVNVGSARELLPSWRAAGRATNGHSTLIVDDALSAVFETARLGRVAARPIGPPGVHAQRIDDDDGARIDAQHEGYRADYGLVHRRTLFLDKSGLNVRGLDVLARPLAAGKAANSARVPYAIRFHLDPGVNARRLDASSVHLETASGAHWRLRTDAPHAAIEDSISLSARPLPLPTNQIVLSGEADPNGSGDAAPNRVRWALTRLDPPLA